VATWKRLATTTSSLQLVHVHPSLSALYVTVIVVYQLGEYYEVLNTGALAMAADLLLFPCSLLNHQDYAGITRIEDRALVMR
jgi:hypothetical protein